MVEIVLSMLGGLVLFLYAINNLSDAIKKAVGDNAQKWILRFTSNTFTSILVGIAVTTLLDSSSAVIIITIVFVNAKILSFKQAMGIVLGANIGTTVSSQIIAMDIGKFSPILLLVGFLLLFVSKSEKINSTGKIILFFGVLFFGLFTMENAVEPLKSKPFVVEWLKRTEQPVQGSLIGALITLIIQSSSATVGMAIILSKKGLLTLAGGVAIMIGAELGTCSDTLLATIKGSRSALKTGLFHLLFNLLSVMIGLLLFQPFLELVKTVSQHSSIERAVANAHMIFNISGVLLIAPCIPLFEKYLNRMLPDLSPFQISSVPN
jgi:phosphate:Na+ symporter